MDSTPSYRSHLQDVDPVGGEWSPMRMFILWMLLVILGNLNAQTLVVAGYESESQRKIAERLIEQSREKSWNRREWEAHCRENGYVVVGSGDVIYLIPVYYTPEFIEYSLVLFVEHLAQLHLKVTTLGDAISATKASDFCPCGSSA